MIVITQDVAHHQSSASSLARQAWHQVNAVITNNLLETADWRSAGYDGTSDLTRQLYGFRIHRDKHHKVEFIFDNDADYTAFLLMHT